MGTESIKNIINTSTQACANFKDAKKLAQISTGLGSAMPGLEINPAKMVFNHSKNYDIGNLLKIIIIIFIIIIIA
jgi:hypothetical protein